MFQDACRTVRESVYGLVARTKTKKGKRIEVACSNGSGFMISPGIIATAAHTTHKGNMTGPNHTEFLVIRAPDIGSSFEKATFLAEDKVRDIAFLKIEKPKSTISLTLEESIIPRGTNCGSLGFPLAVVKFHKNGRMQYSAYERFLGGHISHYAHLEPGDYYQYETDYIVYGGSSGCPGFLINGNVFGLQKGTVPSPKQKTRGAESERIAISRLVPSTDIIDFANKNGITL